MRALLRVGEGSGDLNGRSGERRTLTCDDARYTHSWYDEHSARISEAERPAILATTSVLLARTFLWCLFSSRQPHAWLTGRCSRVASSPFALRGPRSSDLAILPVRLSEALASSRRAGARRSAFRGSRLDASNRANPAHGASLIPRAATAVRALRSVVLGLRPSNREARAAHQARAIAVGRDEREPSEADTF